MATPLATRLVAAVMARLERIEALWKKSWFGLLLIAAGAAVLVRFALHLPPPGFSVTAMAVVAGVMALRVDISGREKWLWFALLLAFMAIEVRAINKDRKNQDEKFTAMMGQLSKSLDTSTEALNNSTTAVNALSDLVHEEQLHFDQTMGAIGDSVKTQTGGDSFAFISFTAEPAVSYDMHWADFLAPRGKPYFLVSITSRGKYPVRGAHATMMDDERRLVAMQEYNTHPDGDWMKVINSVDTEYQLPYLRPQSPEAPNGEVDMIGLYPMSDIDSRKLTISFSAPNGYWNEVLHLGRINGFWHQCLSVMGPTVKQATHPYIYCDSDWSDGKKLAQKDWVFTPPSKQK